MPNAIKYGNQIRLSEPTLLTRENQYVVKKFECENYSLDEYFTSGENEDYIYAPKKAITDDAARTFFRTDMNTGKVVCYYTLSCASISLHRWSLFKHKAMMFPAVEIKMFALDKDFKHKYYSRQEEINKGLKISDVIFKDVLREIFDFTEKICGATHVILYSVPNYVGFYSRNGFSCFDNNCIINADKYLRGCIPMYAKLK